MTGIEKAIKIIGASKLSEALNVSEPMISKAKSQGYGSSDWYQVIVSLSNGRISYDELYNDLKNNKRNFKPQVKFKQSTNPDSPCQKCRQRVGKHRQKAAS